MTGVRAEWHLAELSEGETDPFGAVAHSVGVSLDLTASEEELNAQLSSLLNREGRLDANGITCPLKDGGQDCRSCPQSKLGQDAPLSALCALGNDEMVVSDELMGRTRARRGDVDELSDLADEMTELGHLSDELAELAELTEVGA